MNTILDPSKSVKESWKDKQLEEFEPAWAIECQQCGEMEYKVVELHNRTGKSYEKFLQGFSNELLVDLWDFIEGKWYCPHCSAEICGG